MNILQCISIEIEALQAQRWDSLSQFSSAFHQQWQELGRRIQEQIIQQRIEAVEQGQQGCRQIRARQYHTALGSIILKRRIYDSEQGSVCWADQRLGLPENAWLPEVLELASVLGIGSEFPNAHRLFERWSGISITEKTLANQVEASGQQLQQQEFDQAAEEPVALDSILTKAVAPKRVKPRLYIGVDGVMTPLNQQQGYKEALVGVLFWESAHWQVSAKRAVIRHREYVATLQARPRFVERMNALYTQVVQQQPHQVIVLGDGAHWIWQMAEHYFPHAIEILDFFHVSEYIWAVAKVAFPQHESHQKAWVNEQQTFLKQSQWQRVVQATRQLSCHTQECETLKADLIRYLSNNQTRIDYRRYLQMGLMIGSGVVESSNRRVVTQRLKQAGMHWSKRGAEAVMALRACYLSDSQRWQKFWYPHSA